MAEDEELTFKVEYATSNRSTCVASKKTIPQGALRMGPMVQSTKGDFKFPVWHLFDYFEGVWLDKNPGKLKSLTQISGLDKLRYEDAQKVKALVIKGDSEEVTEATEEEKELAKENKMVWALREKLEANLEANEMKQILEDAEQPASGPIFGGKTKVLQRLADAMLFGYMPPCSECGGPATCTNPGQMVFSHGKYKCIGYVSEYAKCTYTTTTMKRRPWKRPKWCDNDFLKKFKFKMHPKVMASLEGEAPEEDGKPTPSATPSASVGSASLGADDDADARKRKAEELEAKFKADPGAAEEAEARPEPAAKKKKLTVKGRAAVAPESGVDAIAHVLDVAKDEIYNVTLSESDITSGKNSFYVLQLLEADDKKRYWLFRQWGRVGSNIGGKKLEEFRDLAPAKKLFCKLYKDKSGNDWEDRNDFEKKPGKMMQLEIDYGQEADDAAPKAPYAGPLPKPVQELLQLMFDKKAMQDTLKSMEIDTEKMPLGKLSKKMCTAGYQALTSLQHLLAIPEEDRGDDFQLQLVSETNKFYTIIPHQFGGQKPPLIDNLDVLKKKTEMMDTLIDMEIATSLMADDKSGRHWLDASYEKLNADLEPVARDSAEFKTIDRYVKNTHGHTHTAYRLEIVDLFRLSRHGEDERFGPNSSDHNRQLLWHGSRLTNWVGIVSQGLRIAPPEAPATGYMFGKGVYFADMSTKSANYCFTHSDFTTGLMALSEVALGTPYEVTAAKYMDKPPDGYDSTWGVGKFEPDFDQEEALPDGCKVPNGKAGASKRLGKRDSTLLYNEFVVYEVAKVRMRYLLRLKFNYLKKTGTFF
eukprot:TRINITY_DN93487_c0_g1_i1.p1 TRINITY_DN93487_c0_g1~~TRINITY_DN93487_c0_g1_i1.p1  ORF type:complete len:813 (-),score=184.49 TRINITY_DN93487_c0_g1_i1:124-2562(-)